MELSITYHDGIFKADGRDPDRESIVLDGTINNNGSVWYNCHAIFGRKPVISHIIPYMLIRNFVIDFTNSYLADGNMGLYQGKMSCLFDALGQPGYNAGDLYPSAAAFHGSKADEGLCFNVINRLRKVINKCARFQTNMMYGFPRTNEMIDRRFDFLCFDLSYGFIQIGENYRMSRNGAVNGVTNQIQVAYLAGASWYKLNTMLKLPFKKGDLSVLLCGMENQNNFAPNKFIQVISSQVLNIELHMKNKQKFIPLLPNVYFAHKMEDGVWLLFEKATIDDRTVFMAIP